MSQPKAKSHPEELTERYNREAEVYRDLWAPILHDSASRLVRALEETPASRIVDVGSGVGTLLPVLQEAFAPDRLLGVDRSRRMLAMAPGCFSRAVMDATQLAIADGSVDLVIQAFMLFHLERPADGLREARRILRPTGRVGTVTWGDELNSPAFECWSKCLTDFGSPAADPALQTRHAALNSPFKMEQTIRAAGFDRARCWQEEMVATIDLEQLLALRTRMGSEKLRFDALDMSAQAACVAEARRRLTVLAPDDFVARGLVILGVGMGS